MLEKYVREFSNFEEKELLLLSFYSVITAANTTCKLPEDGVSKKGKVRLWVFQHLCLEGVLYSYPNELLHSSPEALHTKRRERPLSVKEGTISEFS
jgi:hypothetical protein